MAEYELRLNFEVVQASSGEGGGAETYVCTQTDTHINTMTWPGLGAGPSENVPPC